MMNALRTWKFKWMMAQVDQTGPVNMDLVLRVFSGAATRRKKLVRKYTFYQSSWKESLSPQTLQPILARF